MSAINELLQHMLSEDGERLETRIYVKLMGDYHVIIELSRLGALADMFKSDYPRLRIYNLVNTVIDHFSAHAEIASYTSGEVFKNVEITVQDRKMKLVTEKCHVDKPDIHIRSVLERDLSFYDHVCLVHILSGILPDQHLVANYFNKSFRFTSTFTETQIKPLGTAGYHQ